ncbi:MAG: SPOR domain-containing protein [Ignavibacteria bacterium]|nr:SPOR domain-containing protein [Ignavibacteria bacterium]
MISKTQLVKKIAGKAGLLPFDSDQFFEVFLSRISNRLKAGEVLEIKDFGYFSLKNCKIKSESGIVLESAEKEKPIPMVLFSEDKFFNEENKNIHFFSIPELGGIVEDDIQSHLSLSIEKPLVTESEFAEEIFSSFKSNSEILNNFNSKAEILISTLQKVNVEIVEEFTLSVLPQEFTEENINDEKETRNEENIRSKDPIERKTISISQADASSLPWDFGRKFFERKIHYPEQEKIDAQRQKRFEEKEAEKNIKSTHDEKINEETIKENLDTKLSSDLEDDAGEQFNDDEDITTEEKASDEKIGNYEQVRTFISGDLKSKEKLLDSESDRVELEANKTDSVKKPENEFVAVKSKSEAYKLERRKKRKKAAFFKKRSISLAESKEKYDYYRHRKRSVLTLIIPFAILILAIGAVYLYLSKDSIFSSEPEKVLLNITLPPHVNIIERDFEFAVTFPYSKSENYDEILGIDPLVFKEDLKLVEQTPKEKVKQPERKTLADEKPVEKVEEKVESKKETVTQTKQRSSNKNITKYKDYYIVQVSAYKTYEAAELEAEKYRNEGYNAFIEIAELPGKGTWYRIKVGDFTSVKHAEDFFNKNRN